MGPKLPILTVVGLLAAGWALSGAGAQAPTAPRPPADHLPADSPPAGQPAARPVDGQTLLEQAILALEHRGSVSARIAHSVDLFGHKPAGSGTYSEERSDRGLRLRLEVKFQLAGETGTLLHVCDGRYLWKHEQFGDRQSLTRIDVERVTEALEQSGNLGELGRIGWWPGLGGLPKLLRGLHAAFDFPTVEQTRLGEPPLPVWRLGGHWKPEKLSELLPDQKKNIEHGKRVHWEKLAPHLPDHVVLFLGMADGFPYRIEYRRREPGKRAADEGAQDRAIVTIKLHEVSFDPAIHPTQFLFSPGDLEFSDATARFLNRLSLAP